MGLILRLIFVPIELIVAGFAFFEAITIGGWWIAGLIAYSIWLLYSGGVGGTLWNLGISLVLAITYMMGGYIGSVGAFVVMLILGEIFMKPKTETYSNPLNDFLKK